MRIIYLLAAVCAAGHGTFAAAQQVPPELADLIPESAEQDPESWAAEGVEDAEAEPAPPPPPPPAPADFTDAFVEGDAEAWLEPDPDLLQLVIPEDIPVPEPLAEDPEVKALAQIDAPDLIELPDLVETQVSDQLILAFPADAGQFPDRDEFLNRFRALSNILAVEGDDIPISQLIGPARADEALLDDVLRNYGYYDAEVIRELSGGRRNQPRVGSDVDTDPRVRFDIIPGRQYLYGAIELGALDSLGDLTLRGAFGIYPGDPVKADRIIKEQIDLGLALGEGGYPFAVLGEPSLLIDHARYQGDLTLPVDPGGRYVFADVTSSKPNFLSGRHLGRIAQFAPGDPYKRSLQDDLRTAVLATGLVSAVSITPRKVKEPQGDEPGEVAIDVALEPAPLRTIAGAIGYGTEEGIRVEASWEHRNLLPPEGALRLRGVLGTRETLGSVAFRRNNFRGRDQILTLEAFAGDTTTEAVEARTVGLRASFEKVSNLLFQKPLSYSFGAEFLLSDERNRVVRGIPRDRQAYTLGGVFGRVTWDGSDDLLDPTKGFRTTVFVAPEYSNSNSQNVFYLRSQVDAAFYQSVGSTVLAGRIRGAANFGAEPFQIAPSRRLYAGGGGSVRGYGFQGIGPVNDFGEPTGGGALVEIGLEARIQTGLLDNSVEVVPFFDAGSVSLGSTPDFRFIQYGAGIGVRYKTDFGPIRVDVGVPLNPGQFDSPVVVYVGLGQAF